MIHGLPIMYYPCLTFIILWGPYHQYHRCDDKGSGDKHVYAQMLSPEQPSQKDGHYRINKGMGRDSIGRFDPHQPEKRRVCDKGTEYYKVYKSKD